MRVTGLLTVSIFIAAVATARADVTITQSTTNKVMKVDVSGESVTRIKGHKMRTDLTTKDGEKLTTIFDLDAQTMVNVDHKKKEATVLNMAEARDALAKISDAGVKSDLKPTGETRQVAGLSCAVYHANVSVSVEVIPGQPMTILLTGPFCLSKDAPGRADFAAFYAAAAEKGLFFQDPRSVKAQPGPTKGMVALYKAIGEAGIPLSEDLAIKFEGTGMMATIMAKMGGGQIQGEATKVEAGPIADDLFQPPADYKITKK